MKLRHFAFTMPEPITTLDASKVEARIRRGLSPWYVSGFTEYTPDQAETTTEACVEWR